MMPIINEATTATQKVVSSTLGIVIPKMVAPGKLYGESTKSETMVVRAKRASTLISHANKPTVKRLRGKKSSLSKGTKIKLINIKAKAPITRLFSPPV